MLATLLLATCVSVSLRCGDRVQANGCTRVAFDGQRGDVVAATIRPLLVALENPQLSLETPLPDFHPPVVSGGKTVTLRYVLPASGTSTFTAQSDAPYLFALDCTAAKPDIPCDCVREYLTDGMKARWELTEDACRYVDENRFADPYYLYGVAGDPVTITMTSPFAPRIAVYTFDSGERQLIVDAPSVTFIPLVTGRYFVMATSAGQKVTGPYELTMSARESGCALPIIVRQPDDRIVPYGSRARLTVDVDATPQGLFWEWLDRTATPAIAGSEQTLVTPPVLVPQAYALQVTNGCGSVMTRMMTVSPASSHRRASR